MAIETDGTSSQYINWGTSPPTNSFTRLVHLLWLVRYDNLRGTVFTRFNVAGNTGWACSIEDSGGFRFFYRYFWSGSAGGLWRADTILSAGTYHLAIDYSKSAVSNDPRMWVNGTAQTISETIAPSGSATADTNDLAIFDIPGASDTNYGINGKILSYNILDATDMTDSMVNLIVSDAYNSRLAIPTTRGLVFAPNLCGAAGLQTFDGATLAAGNTIADQVSGALGVPAGSAIARADTYLTYEGMT